MFICVGFVIFDELNGWFLCVFFINLDVFFLIIIFLRFLGCLLILF